MEPQASKVMKVRCALRVVDAFVQHAVRHHRDEVPLGVRQRLAVDLQVVSARVERYGVILLFFQRRVKPLKRTACRGRGRAAR